MSELPFCLRLDHILLLERLLDIRVCKWLVLVLVLQAWEVDKDTRSLSVLTIPPEGHSRFVSPYDKRGKAQWLPQSETGSQCLSECPALVRPGEQTQLSVLPSHFT